MLMEKQIVVSISQMPASKAHRISALFYNEVGTFAGFITNVVGIDGQFRVFALQVDGGNGAFTYSCIGEFMSYYEALDFAREALDFTNVEETDGGK